MLAKARMAWPGLPPANSETGKQSRELNRGQEMNRSMKKSFFLHSNAACLAVCVLGFGTLPAGAQSSQKVVAKPPVTTPSTGGNSFDGPGDVRYQGDRDPQDRRIDMFIGDWRKSMPRHAYGSLVLR